MPKVKGGRPTKSDKRSKITNKKVGTKEGKKSKKDKKSKGTAIVVVPQNPNAGIEVLPPEAKRKMRLTKKRLKALQALKESQFKHDLPSIMEMIGDDGSIDEVQKRFLISALAVVVNLIPELEDKLHTSQNESGTYALKALLAEGREIFHDIRALANTQLVAIRIAETVIDPLFTNLANFFVTNFHALRTQTEELVLDDDKPKLRLLFQEVAKSFGENLRALQAETKYKIADEIE